MLEADFTLTTGPTMVGSPVLQALSSPVYFHNDPVFVDRFRATERKVAAIFETKGDVVLMQGETILGLEAACRALVRPGTVVVNVDSGVYGHGIGKWLRSYGATVIDVAADYNDAVDPAAVARVLDEHDDVELLTVVHCETPAGTLNPIDQLGPIAKAHGVLTFVDCASSLGGVPLKADDWGLDVCVAGPQKCLGGLPGISLMSVSARAWEAIRANPEAPRGSFLSLLDWKEQWLEGGRFPYTPSVSEMNALAGACDQLLDEGLQPSIARHQAAAVVCRLAVRAMGLSLWPRSDEIASSSVTAVALPDGIDERGVVEHARARYGVMLSAGSAVGNVVGIGHMGATAAGLYPLIGAAALGQTLRDLGVTLDVGRGLEAGLEAVGAASASGRTRRQIHSASSSKTAEPRS